MLKLTNLHKTFNAGTVNEKKALNGLNFQLDRGDFATIVGSTTAGKGVLLSDPQSLSDGSAVVITVGILLDNEGKNWNGTGLTPDVDASLTNNEQSSYYDFTVDNDPQITKAINAISGANGQ